MNTSSEKKAPTLHLAYDVGHDSIGWAIMNAPGNAAPTLLGCGTVIFPADDCLASQRRGFRRQRRHIRATRQRIDRLGRLLEHVVGDTHSKLMSELALYREAGRRSELAGKGHKAPWLLAARVLQGGPSLDWMEMWQVLRWYAHNRGYDGNRGWSRHEADLLAVKEDTEKVQNAKDLKDRFGTSSMAETWCAYCGLNPLTDAPNWPGEKRPKGLNAAFPRDVVQHEVRRVLAAHRQSLPGLSEELARAIMTD